jgi:hypothetical protein
MPEETLILKRDPNARYTESYNVLFEGRCVGRIYKAVSHAPRETPWFWGLDFFEWQGSAVGPSTATPPIEKRQ